MSLPSDSAHDIERQVGHALADEAAQPLTEVQRVAPEGCDYFSELEASISEWSFGYGVAWALARMHNPLLGSSAVAQIADDAVRSAWRSFSGQSWTALMADDRAQRGPVEGETPATTLAPAPPPPPAAAPEPPGEAPAPPAPEPEQPSSQYGDFMGKVARARPRRFPARDE